MSVYTLIPKDHPDLPDCYGIEVFFINGKKEVFEGTHLIIDRYVAGDTLNTHGCPYLEIKTLEDEIVIFPMGSVQHIRFDKRFSQVVAIREEMKKANNVKSS